jgi:type VI protein secretion system component VasK
MKSLKVLTFLGICVVLGIIGGIAARSIFAGIMLAGLVFGGWFLWRLFKLQNEKDGLEEKKTEEVQQEPKMQEVNNNQDEQVQQQQ